MTTKDKANAIKSILFGLNQVIYGMTDFLDYGDETEHAIIEALNGLHQQTWALNKLIERMPF